MNHWRTTLLGIFTIVGALGHAAIELLNGQHPDWNIIANSVTAGIGLILAADGKVSQ